LSEIYPKRAHCCVNRRLGSAPWQTRRCRSFFPPLDRQQISSYWSARPVYVVAVILSVPWQAPALQASTLTGDLPFSTPGECWLPTDSEKSLSKGNYTIKAEELGNVETRPWEGAAYPGRCGNDWASLLQTEASPRNVGQQKRYVFRSYSGNRGLYSGSFQGHGVYC